MTPRRKILIPACILLCGIVVISVFLNNRNRKAADSAPEKPDLVLSEHLNSISDTVGAINVYFNKTALPHTSRCPGNAANYNVNLEKRLISRISGAVRTIDCAIYELNLPALADAFLDAAARGVRVRMIADAKNAADPHYARRDRTMRLLLEKLVRGRDGRPGTRDDVHLFSDSPLLAVQDSTLRTRAGLPLSCADFPHTAVRMGRKKVLRGRLLCPGERKKRGGCDSCYYAPEAQMHNKFVILDTAWVWTGSWNFTVTGLYGSRRNMQDGILGGNQQHCVELHAPYLARVYTDEFTEMWGAPDIVPDPVRARFHGRKTDNTLHTVTVGGRLVEVYFSPGDRAVDRITNVVKASADRLVCFSVFAFSWQPLVDVLKTKWETSAVDFEGRRTGFGVYGVFETSFWNQWWSASVDMTGRTASRTSDGNPNTRWYNPAPVYPDAESRKLHGKTMIVDPYAGDDPLVITGSANWSVNGQKINDENILIIHDARIADQFMQEFRARYAVAGGTLPDAL